MIIKQLTVFLQNESGRLEELAKTLSDNGININAISIAENESYGVMRMIVSDNSKAEDALKKMDFTVKNTDVISIECPDVPGSLYEALRTLSKEGISVKYMYGYSNQGKARLIIKTTNQERGMELLEKYLQSI